VSSLDVPGARLYYETYGKGPLMLLIPGASGTVSGAAVDHLGAHFTVLTYDRRGFSRSRLDGPQDYDHTSCANIRRSPSISMPSAPMPIASCQRSDGSRVATLAMRQPWR
jgi:pimeloyl-ACP methyl ester carboxylesterase